MNQRFSSKFLRNISTKSRYINTKHAGKSALAVAVMFVPVFIFVWLQIQCMGMSYELNGLIEARNRLKSQNRELSYKLKYLASEASIEKTARELYGFRSPNGTELCMVKREKTITEKISELFAKDVKTRGSKRGS